MRWIRCAGVVTDGHLGNLVDTREVAARANGVFSVSLLPDTGRKVDVLLLDTGRQLLKGNVIRVEFDGVDIDDNRPRQPSRRNCRSDPVRGL